MDVGYIYGSTLINSIDKSCPISCIHILYDTKNIQYKIFTGLSSTSYITDCSYIIFSSLCNKDIVRNNGRGYSTYLDNNHSTLEFNIYIPNEEMIKVLILEKRYEKEEKKDAFVYGLKRNLETFNDYNIFQNAEEFDTFMTTEFVAKYCMKFQSHEVISQLNSEIEVLKATLEKRINDNKEVVSTAIDTIEEKFLNFQNTINTKIEDNNQDIESLIFHRQQKEEYKFAMTCNVLTPTNLLDYAVKYAKTNKLQGNVVDVLKHMINSSEFILSDDFKTHKLDLKDIQFKFKMLACPESISHDEILYEVFNINTIVSLI